MGQIIYADAIHRVEQAKIDAARLTQAASNERSAAESALARFSADLGNKRRMDAAGDQIANINRIISRNQDAKVSGDLNQEIALAEELGRSTTMAAAANLGGSSVSVYNQTVKLRAALQRDQGDRAFNSDIWAAGQDKGNTIRNAVAGLDNSAYRANLDYTKYVDHKKMGIFERVAWLGAAATATYFGGPQGGQAVLSMMDAKNSANNGDFASASASVNGAIKATVGAVQDYRQTGGNGFFNTRAGSNPQLPQINVTQPGGDNLLWDSSQPNTHGGYGGWSSFTLR